jgi:large subunit ribosomal protein L29
VSKLKERRGEIRGMDMAGAQHELKDLRRRLFELRLQKERGEVKNNRQFMQIRADIARLMHHISELRHAEVVEAEGGLEETPAPTSAAPPRAARTTTPVAATSDEEEQA